MTEPGDERRFGNSLLPDGAPSAPYGGFARYHGVGPGDTFEAAPKAAPVTGTGDGAAQPGASFPAPPVAPVVADGATYRVATSGSAWSTVAPVDTVVDAAMIVAAPHAERYPPAPAPSATPALATPSPIATPMPMPMPPAPPAEPTIFGPAPVPLHGQADPALDPAHHPVVDAGLALAPTVPSGPSGPSGPPGPSGPSGPPGPMVPAGASAPVVPESVAPGPAPATPSAATPALPTSGVGPGLARRRRRRWRTRILWLALLVVTLLLGAVLGWAIAPQPQTAQRSGMPSMDPRPVQAVTGDLSSTLEVTGVVVADPRVDVNVGEDGTVAEVPVEVGQGIPAGAIVARMLAPAPPPPPTTRAPATTKPPSAPSPAPAAPAVAAGDAPPMVPVGFVTLRPARRSSDITTPVAGIVKEVRVKPGQDIGAGEVVVVVQPTSFRIVAAVRPADLYRLGTPPSTLHVTIPNGPAPFDCGDVRLGDPGARAGRSAESAGSDTVDPGPVGADLSCRVPDGVKVFAGLDATVAAVTGDVKGAVLIPLTAVSGRAGRGTVTVVGADGSQTPREVQLGIDDGVRIQVVSGLTAGDEVLDMLPPPDNGMNNASTGSAGGAAGGGPAGSGSGSYRDDGGS